MEFCKVTLTLKSSDEILWCDHSNETSSVVLSHCAICFSKFHKIKLGNFARICFWLNVAVKGLRALFIMCFHIVLFVFQNFTKWNLETLLEICFWPNLAVKGLRALFIIPLSLKSDQHQFSLYHTNR